VFVWGLRKNHLICHNFSRNFKFELIQELFCILKIKNNPKRHWMNSNGWGIVEAMHDIIFSNIKNVVHKTYFFYISANEHNGLTSMSMS
jgi:hypothetical protein